MSKRNREENLLKSFIKSIDPSNLPPFQKSNILLSFIILLLVFILNAQPVMIFIENIVFNICNTFIIIFTKDKENLLETSIHFDTTKSIIAGTIFLCVEILLCTIFCYKAKEKNKEQKQAVNEEKDDIKSV